jgi:hypothetical protein
MYTATMGAALPRHEIQRAYLILLRAQVVLLALMLWTIRAHPAAEQVATAPTVDAAPLVRARP